MSKISCLCALTLLSISHVELEAACTNTWNTTTGNWGSTGQTANWTAGPACVPGEPGSATDVANFTTGAGGTVTLANLAGAADVSPLLNELNIANANYTFQQRGGGAGILHLTTSPSINSTSTVSTITAPVTIDSDTTIHIDGSTVNSSLTFGTSSSLSATAGMPTLTITQLQSNSTSASLLTNSTTVTGFADTLHVVMNTPSSGNVVQATNSGNFGLHSPSITLNDQTIFENHSSGVMGSTSTPLTLNNTTIEELVVTNDTAAHLNASTLTVNQSNPNGVVLLTNNGILTVATTLDLTNSLGFNGFFTNVESNPVTMAGNGCTTTVQTLTTASTSKLVINTENLANVSGAGPSNGNYFQIVANPLTLYNNCSLQNETAQTMAESVTGTSNTGSFFDATNVDVVTQMSAGMFTANIVNDNGMPVSGGATGAKMSFNSLTLSPGNFETDNEVNALISGTNSIGAHSNVTADVTSVGGGITVINQESVSGTGSIGALSTIGNDLTISNSTQVLCQNNATIAGMGTVGSKITIGGDLHFTTATFMPIGCYNNGNITATAGGRGTWIEIGGNLNLQDGVAGNESGLFCNNSTGPAISINGDATTIGTYCHIPTGNVTLSGEAALQSLNGLSATVAFGGGTGSIVAIDNAMATFSMADTAALVAENLGSQSNYGVCALINAAPLFQMSGGTLYALNFGSLQNLSLTNPNYATTLNFNGGINCTDGTMLLTNGINGMQTPILENAKGVVLNIGTSLNLAGSSVVTMSNAQSLFPDMSVNPFTGSSNGSALNAGTLGSPIDVTLSNTVNMNNTYNVVTNQTGTIDSIGVAFNASRNLSLSSGAHLNLTNTLPGSGTGFLTSSTGVLANISGALSATGAQITLQNSGNFESLDMSTLPGNYFGSRLTAASLALQNSSVLNLTNTGSDQTTTSIGCQVSTGSLTIQSSSQLHLSNTNSHFTSTSRGTELLVTGTFDMSGQYLTNVTTGGSADGTSFGSLIQSTLPIQVNQGTFINDAQVNADSVPVAHGATLAGNGTFSPNIAAGTDVTSHGTVYPGDPTNPTTSPSGPTIGIMLINGTYTQESDGNFFVNILDIGTFSRLHVLGTGTADLQGAITVGMLPGAVITASDTYNIIQTQTGLTNQSLNPTVLLDSSYTSPLIPQIRYITGPVTLAGALNVNIVQLYFMHSPTPPATAPLLTSYSFSFETLFDLINRDNLILEREMQRMRLRYQHESVVTTQKSSSRRVAQSNTPRANISFDQPSIITVANKTPGNSLAFARYRNEIEQQRMGYSDQDRPWNFFIGPVGDVGTIKTKQNQIGSDYWTAGGLTSFNYVFSQGGIGLFADYNKVKANVHRHWGNFNFDMAHSCLYGTYSPKQAPDLAFHSIVGGSYEWYTINRKSKTGTAKGKTQGGEFDALFTGEYVFSGTPCSDFPEHLTIIPRAGVQYIYVDANRYKEHGASTSDLAIHALHAKSLRSIVDLWMKYSWEWTNVKLTPELNIGWQREFFDKNHNVFFTPIALPTSSVRAFGAGRNTFLAGLDLFLEFYEKYALEASYDFQWNRLIRDNGFYLGFHARF
jgi:hypothetical protein